MKPDPIDEQSARLFEAARREPLPDGAKERVLEAARRLRHETAPQHSFRQQTSTAVLLAAALGAVLGIVVLARHHEPVSPITAEPPGATSRVRPEPTPSRAAEATSDPLSSSAPPLVPRNPVANPPLRPVPVTLSDELAELKRAETALGSGDTRTAFEALDRYDRVLKGKQMRAEATLLRIETLARAGQPEAASALATRFLKENPGSPLVDRAESFLAKSSDAGRH